MIQVFAQHGRSMKSVSMSKMIQCVVHGLLPKLGTSRTIFKVNLCVELENTTRGGWRPVLVLKEGALDFDLFV